MISEEIELQLIENNNKISELLKENEKLIVGEGYNPPINNYALEKDKRISFPSGYIRVNESFKKKYHLNEIVADQSTVKNISYSLQLSDFYNYIINRFYVWGSIETMLFKSAIINLVSIIEALIFECANNICSPSNCKNVKSCILHFSKNQRSNSYEALMKINELKITDFSDLEMNRIGEIINLRNRIHIRLATENEFNSSDFSLQLYNEVIGLLQRISTSIYQNGIVLYNSCNKCI